MLPVAAGGLQSHPHPSWSLPALSPAPRPTKRPRLRASLVAAATEHGNAPAVPSSSSAMAAAAAVTGRSSLSDNEPQGELLPPCPRARPASWMPLHESYVREVQALKSQVWAVWGGETGCQGRAR